MVGRFEEPIFDVAQLAHVEIFSPKPEETVNFFTQLLGMEVTGRAGQSVYLRAYEDHYHHTLKITEDHQAGLGHASWRATSPQALVRRVNAIKESGLGIGWIEGDLGHGPAYQFTTPDGHLMEILWDVEYNEVSEEQKTVLLNRASKRPNRGVPVRRIDHINLMASNPEKNSKFMMDTLGFRLTEKIVDESGYILGTWLSVSNLVHETAFMNDPTGLQGRFHHICYWYGTPQHLYDIADLCKENDIFIELGPRKHSISQAHCLYVYEPGGNRVELFGDAGYLIFDPAWKPVVWDDLETVSARGIGAGFTESYWVYGTPREVTIAVEK
ncbi:catechol 2,3-dioxygenase [Bacillus sp. FJAT-50079]|uniref:catechol 2,3-dioxygenase n=1 Tax=Bacillus sp. FJAT-50079 TaxID=2833577 RepID=UPI001BCA05D7|nr:catechol 2,3-dioxygenase [Bacillus sp. FJAT-50079]MBS4208312.1 catechol 2,3-dioxygenase [Bacillus sp. FJAT-50079]